MLKIRDDINLKELEKYGFEDYESFGRKTKIKKFGECGSEVVEIDKITGQLQIFIDDEYYEIYTNSKTLDFIYDLIKANLIEKVEDKYE